MRSSFINVRGFNYYTQIVDLFTQILLRQTYTYINTSLGSRLSFQCKLASVKWQMAVSMYLTSGSKQKTCSVFTIHRVIEHWNQTQALKAIGWFQRNNLAT